MPLWGPGVPTVYGDVCVWISTADFPFFVRTVGPSVRQSEALHRGINTCWI